MDTLSATTGSDGDARLTTSVRKLGTHGAADGCVLDDEVADVGDGKARLEAKLAASWEDSGGSETWPERAEARGDVVLRA